MERVEHRQEGINPVVHNDTPDRILRLALLACACDRRSILTKAQRSTIIELGRQISGVPIDILLALREPLLAWCKNIRPTLTTIVTEQYWQRERSTSHDGSNDHNPNGKD